MNISKLQSQYTTEELQKLAAALSVEERKERFDEEELTIIIGGIRPGVTMRPKWKGSSTVM